MTSRGITTSAIVFFAGVLLAPAAIAQFGGRLPSTRADSLLDEGRWTEAEAAFYRQAEVAPRNPVARAALGRYLAMKGAVKPGLVLIDEARKFGLDRRLASELAAPWTTIMRWRMEAAQLTKDSVLEARAPRDARTLFQMGLPHTDADGEPLHPGSVNEVVWYDIVDREVGVDSLNARTRPLGIEIFEQLVPSVDLRTGEVTLHANSRSALTAKGRRYQVLRTPREVQVLVEEGRVAPLAEALRELKPEWWQLDLLHGILVVR